MTASSQNLQKPKFTFIDLFAGIGGFRLALQNLGGKCIFSSEIDENARKTYRENYGETPFGDITRQETKESIPQHFDVLCAGFPCQPFSKGGAQNGFSDTRGTLFFDICKIVEKHKPSFLLLENVPNLVTHDNGNTFLVIKKNLEALGYVFPDDPLLLSPDQFGIPVLRSRIYIPCVRMDIAQKDIYFIKKFNEKISLLFTDKIDSIDTILFEKTDEKISDYEQKVLQIWDEFYQGIDIKVIGFPVWVDYFYEKNIENDFPEWKKKFIVKNQELYQRNQIFIDKWLKKYNFLNDLNPTHKKFEWQAGVYHSSLFEALIQFRPSGVRVKKSDKFSTLVAMNHQQIVGRLRRKITQNEAKLLQSFPKNFKIHPIKNIALKQLGNSVNVKVVEYIFGLLYNKYAENGTNS